MEMDTSNDCNENNRNRNDTQLTQPLANLSPMDSSEAALLANELLSHQIDGERKVENALLLKRPDLKGLSLIFTLFHTLVVTFSAVLNKFLALNFRLGTFRCPICQKQFCHSSSLSRHKLQAHYRRYMCTVCRETISSERFCFNCTKWKLNHLHTYFHWSLFWAFVLALKASVWRVFHSHRSTQICVPKFNLVREKSNFLPWTLLGVRFSGV